VKNSSLQVDLAFIDYVFVIMNSPARMDGGRRYKNLR